MKKTLIALTLLAIGLTAHAQTNTNILGNIPPPAAAAAPATNELPATIIGTLQSYLTQNDPSFNGWQSNHFDLWQAAVFQDENGVPGASAVGNVLGLEVPFWRTASKNTGFHIESMTDFETVFGDVGWQAVGIGYDYNIHQVQISGVLDVDLALQGPMKATAAPGIEFKKASTSLAGASPLIRWDIPIRKSTGAGRVFIGLQFPF